jgi:hypothetical protein
VAPAGGGHRGRSHNRSQTFVRPATEAEEWAVTAVVIDSEWPEQDEDEDDDEDNGSAAVAAVGEEEKDDAPVDQDDDTLMMTMLDSMKE